MFVDEAIILAGGKGTRLQSVVSDVPKVMAIVNGRPFLEYILDYLQDYMIERVVLSVGYKYEQIIDHFGSHYKDIHIEYAIEEEPLGTGGGILRAMEKINGNKVFVMNGDTMFRINLVRFFDFHVQKQSLFSVVLREVEDVSRYGAVEYDEDKKIISFLEKGQRSGKGLINGGVYLIHKRFFNQNPMPEKFSLEKDVFEKMVNTHPFYSIVCRQYFLDIGIPKDYKKAQDDFKSFSN